MRRVLAIATLLALAAVSIINFGPPAPRIVRANLVRHSRIHAQFSTQVPGFSAGANNAVTPTVIGNALAVTNPASNFIVLVQGGPVYCTGAYSGALAEVGQSTLTLVANTTYLLVVNCSTQNVYAKTAVTGPGSSGTSTSGTPPPPTPLLFAIPGLEVPIATVVCNATACGNGGNGSITDNRPLANFPGAGTPMNTVTFAALPTTNVTDGTIIYCSTCTLPAAPATCVGAGTGSIAFRINGAWVCP